MATGHGWATLGTVMIACHVCVLQTGTLPSAITVLAPIASLKFTMLNTAMSCCGLDFKNGW